VCVCYVKVIMLYNSLVMFLLVWYKQDAILFNCKQFEELVYISMPSVIPFAKTAW